MNDAGMAAAIKQIERDRVERDHAAPSLAGGKPAPAPGDNTKTMRDYIDRIVRLEEEKQATGAAIKDIYVEVKSAGFEPKAMRILVKREMETVEQKAAREAVEMMVKTMEDALGAFADSPLGAAAIGRVGR